MERSIESKSLKARRWAESCVVVVLAVIMANVILGATQRESSPAANDSPDISVVTTVPYRPAETQDDSARRLAARGTFPTTSAPIRNFPSPTFVVE